MKAAVAIYLHGRDPSQRKRSTDASVVEESIIFIKRRRVQASDTSASEAQAKSKISGDTDRMRDSRRKAETHRGSDPTTKGTPGTFPGATGGSMKRNVFRLPRARAAGPYPRLARENEQSCTVMFLAIISFLLFWYIIIWLYNSAFLLLCKRTPQIVQRR